MLGRPDAAAIERAGALERDLAAFFAEHYDRLVRLAALVCHSPSLTEDAVQASMEQAWRRRGTLRDPALVRPWLDRIVVRESIRLNTRPWWARLAPGRPTVHEIDVRPEARESTGELGQPVRGSTGSDPDATWIALTVAFRALPVEQRAVVALHLYAGYSIEETASLTGAGIETTRSRLRLARARLRRELGEDER
jgi:RNA polymerase sigma-70 factor (ECF subfamily)